MKDWLGTVRFFNGRFWSIDYVVRVRASTRSAAVGRAIANAETKLKRGARVEGVTVTLMTGKSVTAGTISRTRRTE